MLDGILHADFIEMNGDVSKFVNQIYPYSLNCFFRVFIKITIS